MVQKDGPPMEVSNPEEDSGRPQGPITERDPGGPHYGCGGTGHFIKRLPQHPQPAPPPLNFKGGVRRTKKRVGSPQPKIKNMDPQPQLNEEEPLLGDGQEQDWNLKYWCICMIILLMPF